MAVRQIGASTNTRFLGVTTPSAQAGCPRLSNTDASMRHRNDGINEGFTTEEQSWLSPLMHSLYEGEDTGKASALRASVGPLAALAVRALV